MSCLAPALPGSNRDVAALQGHLEEDDFVTKSRRTAASNHRVSSLTGNPYRRGPGCADAFRALAYDTAANLPP